MVARALFALTLFCSVALADLFAWKADFVLRSETMGHGFVRGTMYFRCNSENTTISVARYDFTEPTTISIIKVPEHRRVYKKCNKCEGAETPDLELAPLRAKDLDCQKVGEEQRCTSLAKTTLKEAFFENEASLWPTRFTLNDERTYQLSNQQSISYDNEIFEVKEEWDCGHCVTLLDLFFLLDGSGSVGLSNWNKMISFVSGVVDMFTLGRTATAVSIITWYTRTHVPWPLSTYHYLSSIDGSTISWYTYASSWAGTMQYLGFQEMEKQILGTSSSKGETRWHQKTKPTIVAIVVTDGVDHYPSDAAYWSNRMQTVYNATVIEVSVGSYTDPAFMKRIASKDENGEPLFLGVDDFEELKTITDSLVKISCSYDKTEDKCGEGCKGFCGCEAQCFCPTCDEDPSKCLFYRCEESGSSSTGCQEDEPDCLYTPDKCEKRTCNEENGECESEPVQCKPAMINNTYECVCSEVTCVSATGCNWKDRAELCPHINCMEVDHCDCSQEGHEIYHGCFYKKKVCTTEVGCLEAYCDEKTDTCQTRENCKENGTVCEPFVCNTETGKCEQYPLVDREPYKNCRTKACDNDIGVVEYWQVDCAEREKDPDPCKEWTCNEETDECTYKLIEGCVSCGSKECDKIACKVAGCSNASGALECVYTDVKCERGDCETGTCNTETNQCEYKTDCEAGNKCKQPKCNSKHNCTLEYLDNICQDETPCSVCECDPDTGAFVYKNPCEENKPNCTQAVCTVEDGKAKCEYPRRTCEVAEDLKKCFNAVCDNETNSCVLKDVDCDDHDPCTDDVCDLVQGCLHKPSKEDKTCEIAVCRVINNTANWTYEPKCPQLEYCYTNHCDINNGECYSTKRTCVEELPMKGYECFTRSCTESRKCYRKLLANATIDICGNCIVPSVQDASEMSPDSRANYSGEEEEEKDLESCLEDLKTPALQTALTAGVIAGIVIAAVVGAAALITSSVLGTKELMKRASRAADQGAQMNPLYETNQREAINPMYEATKE